MNPIFPITTEKSEEQNTLFPIKTCTDSVSNAGYSSCDKGTFDWLKNESYPGSVLQEKEKKDESQSDSDQDIQDTSATVVRKRENEDVDAQALKRKKKKKKHKHKNKKHKARRSRSSSPTGGESARVLAHSNKTFLEELPFLDAADAYRIDRSSNIYNYKYESLYKGHVAAFSMTFHKDLGKKGEDGTGNDVTKKETKKRYFSKDNRKLSKSVPLCQILPQKKSENFTENFIFIETNCSSKKNVESSVIDVRDKLLDQNSSLYLSGKGLKICDAELEMSELDMRRKIKTEEFNRKTRETPQDVDLWLQFINFQDTLGQSLESEGHFKTSKSAILEKKISISKRSIDVNPGSIELKLKYIELCQMTWEPERINKEMEDLIFLHPANVVLWKQYLMFNQGRLSTFTMSSMCKLYQKCISTLVKYQEGTLHTHSKPEDLSKHMLDIFVQLCTSLKQAGHKEKAVALFQALLELNMCCPDNLKNITRNEKVIIFESFWDSGVSRIGETGARGWNYWMENKDVQSEVSNSTEHSLEEEEMDIIKKKSSRWETWLELENLRESAHWSPWQPDLLKGETLDDCEDVDRLVLFEDISHFLFCLAENLVFELCIHFINFLGANRMVKEKFSHIISSSAVTSYECLTDEFHFPDFQNSKSSVEKMFLNSFISNVIQQTVGRLGGRYDSVLKSCWLNHVIEENGEQVDCKKVKKIAKGFLKEPNNRNDISVWTEYACLLWKYGALKDASDVLEMTIPMLCVNMKTESEKLRIPRLYRILVEILLKFPYDKNFPFLFDKRNTEMRSDWKRSIDILVCFCENNHSDIRSNCSSVSKLKAKKKFEEIFISAAQMLEEGLKSTDNVTIEYILEVTKCYTLFEYTFSEFELESSLCILDQALGAVFRIDSSNSVKTLDFKSKEPRSVVYVLENLYRYKVRVIHHHMTMFTTSLHLLRETVNAALEIFQDDVFFLKVFLEMERGCKIYGRIERYLSHNIERVNSPDLVVFAVLSQLERFQNKVEDYVSVGNDYSSAQINSTFINRVRSYLEKSLDNPNLQHCPLLWRLYLYSEKKIGHLERAKGLYFQALQHCPWAKSLYMDSIRLFQGEKLEEIIDLMMEKEIRVQIPLEEMDILIN